jgi:heat-inducible transcriptional repressor
MSIQIPLNARQQQVLSATIRHYIATAEPVGSEALVKEYDIRASSATVRNAMGFLEKVGLLYQPHISAGRVPSDSGYRTYVDRLLQPLPLTTPIDQLLTDRLQGQSWSVEAVFKGASQILATLSGYITLITLPLTRTMELKHVQLVPVDYQRIMMIVVMDTYETESVMVPLTEAVMDLEADLLAQELQILSNFLNEQLRGRSLSELQQLDWLELGQDFERYGSLLATMLQELDRRFTQSIVPTQLMISGVADVLKQPEFSELQQLQTILHLLEAGQSQLFPLIFEASSHRDPVDRGIERVDRRVTVRIGTENILEPIRACTLISSNYNRGPIPLGSVSILGPTRMDYESTIALVEATADYLSERLR